MQRTVCRGKAGCRELFVKVKQGAENCLLR